MRSSRVVHSYSAHLARKNKDTGTIVGGWVDERCCLKVHSIAGFVVGENFHRFLVSSATCNKLKNLPESHPNTKTLL